MIPLYCRQPVVLCRLNEKKEKMLTLALGMFTLNLFLTVNLHFLSNHKLIRCMIKCSLLFILKQMIHSAVTLSSFPVQHLQALFLSFLWGFALIFASCFSLICLIVIHTQMLLLHPGARSKKYIFFFSLFLYSTAKY